MSMSNAERQARFRDKQAARIKELEAQLEAKTLRLYDIGIDEMRDVTQADVDQMMRKLTELLAPKITPRIGPIKEIGWPNLYIGEISDGDRRATVGILT